MDFESLKRFKRSGSYKRKAKEKREQSRSFLAKHNKPLNGQQNHACGEKLESGSVHTKKNILTEPGSTSKYKSFLNTCSDAEDKVGEEEILSFSESSDSDDEIEGKNEEFQKNMKEWAIQFNISHNALRNLLEVVNKRLPNVLPKDPRTLLDTITEIQVIPMGTGYYWHNSLEAPLLKYLETANDVPGKLSLNINIDGLPVSKSSKSQLWPILCTVHEIPKLQPIVIGIYSGQGKPPDVNNYLKMFVDEIKRLTENGLVVKNTAGNVFKVILKIRAFICDSPARAFVKGVCSFNGKDGCLKCVVQGEYSHTSRTIFFPKVGCEKRNDKDFRDKKYGQHHKVDSPLLELPVDMIEDFIVGDSLHLIDLGLMKRLLIAWRDGKFSNSYDTKWCSQEIFKVTEFLLSCKMPKEIHRSVRGLDELCHWKGTEFRTFLHYLSFIILQHTLKPDVFQHFLCLFCAITICSNENYFHFMEVAKALLDSFVQNFKDIYGKDYITSNVHNLTHVVDEVKKFGKLQEFYAYPFENKLSTLKKMIRQGNKPLEQVARRISEISNAELNSANKSNITHPFLKKYKSKHGDVTELHLESYILSVRQKDKWFLSTEDHVIEIQSFSSSESGIIINGNRIDTLSDVFENPIKSSYLNIYKCDLKIMKKTAGVYTLNTIKCKLVSIDYESNIYFVPLLHTL